MNDQFCVWWTIPPQGIKLIFPLWIGAAPQLEFEDEQKDNTQFIQHSFLNSERRWILKFMCGFYLYLGKCCCARFYVTKLKWHCYLPFRFKMGKVVHVNPLARVQSKKLLKCTFAATCQLKMYTQCSYRGSIYIYRYWTCTDLNLWMGLMCA